MQITFYGAVREVTGSMHLLSTNEDNILLDCGMFQGSRQESTLKNKSLPFDPKIISNVILSHAHIDHSGRIPLLTKDKFNGRVISTNASKDVCQYLLLDSAHIQQSDANYLNYKSLRNLLIELQKDKEQYSSNKKNTAFISSQLKTDSHQLNVNLIEELMKKYNMNVIKPLYDEEDAKYALKCFEGYPYRYPIKINKNITCTLYDAGHILGSAISIIKIRDQNKTITIGYTGDLGRFDKPIIEDPTLDFAEEDRNLDLLIMESTYGDRFHEPFTDLKPHLKKILINNFEKRGTIVIPSFAYGRAQEIIYLLHELYNEGDIPKFPVYIDSPLTTNLTQVFGEHPELYDIETHQTFLKKGENPFALKEIHYVNSVNESIKLNQDQTPHIVISASGMCESGRILHHLRYKIHDPINTVLIVGYMAQNTLGRRILEQTVLNQEKSSKSNPPEIKILGKTYPLKADVIQLDGFSAHGDQNEMTKFLKKSNLNIKRIAVVHGEEEQSLSFATHLKKQGFNAEVPQRGQSIIINPI